MLVFESGEHSQHLFVVHELLVACRGSPVAMDRGGLVMAVIVGLTGVLRKGDFGVVHSSLTRYDVPVELFCYDGKTDLKIRVFFGLIAARQKVSACWKFTAFLCRDRAFVV